MKIKRILRFYFRAEGLNAVLDGLAGKVACDSRGGEAEMYAEKLIALIDAKTKLQSLWAYLDGVAERMTEEEMRRLKRYAELRRGIRRLPDEERRAIKRAAVKFVRHARVLEDFASALEIMDVYYALLPPC